MVTFFLLSRPCYSAFKSAVIGVTIFLYVQTLLFSFMSRPYYSNFKSTVISVTLTSEGTLLQHFQKRCNRDIPEPHFLFIKKIYVTLLALFFFFFFFGLVISRVVGFQIFQSLFCILTLTKLQAPRQNELSATHS